VKFKTVMLKLYNTLSRQKEVFKPLKEGVVSMYNCGPTVYNYAHIGNLRAYVFADVLRRTLEYKGLVVNQVINVTDVGHLISDADEGEDKIEKGARREGKTAQEITRFYEKEFKKDLTLLNIRTAGTRFPRATEHIQEQIDLIQKLEKKGFTYRISDGIYFDTSKWRDYGRLAHTNLDGLKEGARVEKNLEKKNPTDFALWKFSRPNEHRQQEWESPWGIGYPGWHIECSAMSMKYLGETFDIHTGGIDHIPIHHTNEIAQSEAATGKPFVRFWLHSAFVNIKGGKMAKSEKNFFRLQTIIDHGISPLAYRLWLLGAHYRTPVNFSWEALEGSQNALGRIYKTFASWDRAEKGTVDKEYKKNFTGFLDDDLDTPKILALVWDLIKDPTLSAADKRVTLLEIDTILGIGFEEKRQELASIMEDAEIPLDELPEDVASLIQEREKARADKEWETADKLRHKIAQKGYNISDTASGPVIFKR
jgi:cysteinyl-tRNA synthetase